MCCLPQSALFVADAGSTSMDVLYSLTQTMDGLVQQQLSGGHTAGMHAPQACAWWPLLLNQCV